MSNQTNKTFAEELDSLLTDLSGVVTKIKSLQKHRYNGRLDHADKAMFDKLSELLQNTHISLEGYRIAKHHFLAEEISGNVFLVNFDKDRKMKLVKRF